MFRTPAVAKGCELEAYERELGAIPTASEARATIIREVESAAERLERRSEGVILGTSIVLTAAIVLLAAGRGIGWLNLVSALCALGSLYLSLFAKLVTCGRGKLGLTPKHPCDPIAEWPPPSAAEPASVAN